MPWHERNGEGTEKEMPYYPGLPTKRTPIKGTIILVNGYLLIVYNSVACALTLCCLVCIEDLRPTPMDRAKTKEKEKKNMCPLLQRDSHEFDIIASEKSNLVDTIFLFHCCLMHQYRIRGIPPYQRIFQRNFPS